MNFLPATLKDGAVAFPGLAWAGPALPLPGHLAAAEAGAHAQVGVRPEDVSVVAAEAGGLRCRVAVCEPLGAETIVTADVQGEVGAPIVARLTGGSPPPVGAEILLRPDPERLHLFGTDDGRRIGAPPTPQGDVAAAALLESASSISDGLDDGAGA